MQYAHTRVINGTETVVTVLPLSKVPLFNPLNAIQPNTYSVNDEVREGWIKSGAQFIAPTQTFDKKVQEFKLCVTNILESKAQELQFDSILEAMTYCDEPSVPIYQKQAQALRAWRSGCWIKYDEIVATNFEFSVAEALKRLPVFLL